MKDEISYPVDVDDAEAVVAYWRRLHGTWAKIGLRRPCHVHPNELLTPGLGGPVCEACDQDLTTARRERCLSRVGSEIVERAAVALDVLSAACFAALGPASSWGGTAKGNADAIRRFGARDHDTWLLCAAEHWTDFAQRTDPDLAVLALEAAGAIGDLARARDARGTLFLMRDYSVSYHAGPWPPETT